ANERFLVPKIISRGILAQHGPKWTSHLVEVQLMRIGPMWISPHFESPTNLENLLGHEKYFG
ncbi:hypothetical protein PJP10_32690, partial [Mycobacterium kansasii]